MSELIPSLVPLDKGLNLQTAKIVAPPGSVLDTLNYEQVDFQGQKRIDGFVRYDGSALSTLDEYYRVELDGPYAGVAGDLLTVGGELLGVAVGSTGNYVYVAIIDYNLIPIAGDTLTVFNGVFLNAARPIVSVATGVATATDAQDHYDKLLEFNAILRSRVEELPGSIIGLHWFRDRLYAVADVTVVSLSEVTPLIYPNDQLVLNGGVATKVLDSFVRGNTRLVFLATTSPDLWQVEGGVVTRSAVAMGTIANGYEAVAVTEEIASFFESRSDAQVADEDGPAGPYDFGWRFVDQGWLIGFDDGLSLYGSLPSLNQNIIGLGTQGPSGITGNNGRPLILNQKVIITDKDAQVSGWKSSQTPTTYELEADNLISVDAATIYADAYISWNSTTTEVIGDVSPLVEYPATNTVVVEI